jgi:primosomal protein N''
VSATDIQRLQDYIYDAGADLSRLRSRDAAQADRLQADLDALREEVIYLKVKLRKEGTAPRSEYSDLRDRIENLRTRARAETSTSATTRTDPTGTSQPTGGSS